MHYESIINSMQNSESVVITIWPVLIGSENVTSQSIVKYSRVHSAILLQRRSESMTSRRTDRRDAIFTTVHRSLTLSLSSYNISVAGELAASISERRAADNNYRGSVAASTWTLDRYCIICARPVSWREAALTASCGAKLRHPRRSLAV